MSQGSFRGLSRAFQGCFSSVFKGLWSNLQNSSKAVSRQFQDGFKEVPVGSKILSRVFQRSFKEMFWKFQRCLKDVPRCFEEVSRVFQALLRVFQGCSVYCCMPLIAATWTEGGLVFFLLKASLRYCAKVGGGGVESYLYHLNCS